MNEATKKYVNYERNYKKIILHEREENILDFLTRSSKNFVASMTNIKRIPPSSLLPRAKAWELIALVRMTFSRPFGSMMGTVPWGERVSRVQMANRCAQ